MRVRCAVFGHTWTPHRYVQCRRGDGTESPHSYAYQYRCRHCAALWGPAEQPPLEQRLPEPTMRCHRPPPRPSKWEAA